MKNSVKYLFVLAALLGGALASSASVFAEDSDSTTPPPTKETPEGFVSLFDGKTLEGWDGNSKFWSVENGCITGRSSEDNPVPYSTYIVWKGEPVKDFTLLVDFCVPGEGNSGIEYRAWKDDARDHGLNGYQADISPGDIMGIFYGEALGEIIAWRGESAKFDANGNKTIEKFGDAAEIGKSINMHGWNTYRVEARGNRFTEYINDVKTTELVDERPDSPKEGIFGLQIHPGPPMFFQFKNIFLKTY
ncbi:MAG: DUF1080 domain-containing protein [Thermoguttaceae bacterium]|nr:DUF1080 domain-containing protein [Thermoguttaceae bacterium]